MEQIILIAHLLIALAIIGLIMLQQGKGADMGASFGAGASQTLFGADGGGNVLTKATAFLAVAFFATSFSLAVISKNKSQSFSDAEIVIPQTQQTAPVEVLDLPTLDDDVPAEMSSEDDIPSVD